jgi:MYXO-CTERM domain-containing protein
MRFLSPLSASLIVLALGGTALAAPSSQSTLEMGSFAQVAGKPLTVAKDADDEALDAAARAVLADRSAVYSHVTLGASRTARLSDGQRIVKLPQTHAGLPVLHRAATVSFGSDGVAHLVTSKLAENLPGNAIPSVDAQTAALAATQAAGATMDPKSGRLVFYPSANGTVLAWTFYSRSAIGGQIGPDGRAVPYAPYVVVDAQTGKVIVRYNAVLTMHQASVYPSNPIKSPALTKVTVPLPDGAMTVSNNLINARNCIDKKTTKQVKLPGVGTVNIHACEVEHTALATEGSLDFSQMPADDSADEDAYAELHIGYHANRVYEMFRGYESTFKVQAAPLDVIANARLAAGLLEGQPQAPNTPLESFSNAFFSPPDPNNWLLDIFDVSGGALIFGQGPARDYSYDADVIYHEFGHAVVEATVQLVGTPYLDEYGVVFSPGSMNEGLADYFSSALTGDPAVGEYAAGDLDPNLESIRDLSAPDACPTAIGGEVHQDATLFSGALWDVRTTLKPDQQTQLDLAVFAAMKSAPSGDLSYEEFANLIIAKAQTSALGATGAQKLSQAFAKRGVLPRCTRILEYFGSPLSGPLPVGAGITAWWSPGEFGTGLNYPLGYSPGVVQAHMVLPENATTLTVRVDGAALSQGASAFSPEVLVRFGSEPIKFTYGPYNTTPDVISQTPTESGGQIKTYKAVVPITPGVKDAYVMIANSGQGDGVLMNLSLSHNGSPVENPTTSSGTGTNVGGGGPGMGGNMNPAGGWGEGGEGGEGGEEADPTDSKGSCGCAVPGDARVPAGAAIAALAALGAVVARRRRR